MSATSLFLISLLVVSAIACAPAAPNLTEPETPGSPVDVAATVAAMQDMQTSQPKPGNTPAAPTPDAGSAKPAETSPTSIPSGAETAAPSAKANEVAGGWLLSFTHTNPDYIRYAHSAFAYAEDGEFCEAAGRFGAIAIDARDYAGERLPIAAYNAGTLYLTLAWDDRRIGVNAMCTTTNPARPAINSAVAALEYALEYMTDDQHKSAAHVLLGRAYANKSHMESTRLVIGEARAKEQAKIVGEHGQMATNHLCQSIALDGTYEELAHKILAEVDGTCGQ